MMVSETVTALRLNDEARIILGLRSDLVGEPYLKIGVSRVLHSLQRIRPSEFHGSIVGSIREWISDGDMVESAAETPQSIPGTSGLKSEYPVHALILQIGREGRAHPPSLRFCAHVIVIAQRLQQQIDNRETDNISGFTLNRTKICRRARRLSPKIVERLVDIPDSPVELHRLAVDQLDRALPTELGDFYVDLERAMAYALGYRDSPQRDGRGGKKKIRTAPREYPLGTAEPDEGERGVSFSIIAERSVGALAPNDSISRGLAPEEEESGTRLLKMSRNLDISAGESPQMTPRRHRDRLRHVMKQSQLLSDAWHRLSEFDVRMLVQELTERAGEGPRACALLALSLMTGTPAEKLLNCQVYESNKALPQAADPQTIHLVAQRGTWHRGVIRPESAKAAHPEWEVYLESSRKRLVFPIAKLFWEVLSPLMVSVSRGLSRRTRLFTQQADAVIESAKRLLSSINRRYQTRLTMLRVQQYLFQALVEGEGDIAEACLITGQLPPAGQPASIYYHHVSNAVLLEKYKNAISKASDTIEFLPHESLVTRSWGIGSQICVRSKALTALVNDLHKAVALARSNWTLADAWIDFHNAYTRYTVMMLMFATGHRAVQDPLPYAEDIDWQRGLIIIDDKSGDYLHKERMIPLPAVCLRQLELYLSHRDSVVARLTISRPQKTAALPVFFFLNEGLQWRNVQSSTLTSQLQDCFDLPLNINRHALRRRLRESGLPGEAVDAFMGHWGEGQNPFGHHSSMDPWVYQQRVREATGALMSDMGWLTADGLA